MLDYRVTIRTTVNGVGRPTGSVTATHQMSLNEVLRLRQTYDEGFGRLATVRGVKAGREGAYRYAWHLDGDTRVTVVMWAICCW